MRRSVWPGLRSGTTGTGSCRPRKNSRRNSSRRSSPSDSVAWCVPGKLWHIAPQPPGMRRQCWSELLR
eukprot:5159148-Lingulodinium_polyedra.AAC.1